MKSITERFKGARWFFRGLVFCAVIYMIYIALSFFYLPGKLKKVIETDASRMTGREIRVGDIRFNPFYLSLTIKGLSVSDTPEAPLIAWDQVLVNLSFWRSLFLWGIAFDEISLDNPLINIIKYREGFNFSNIITNLSSSEKDADQPDKKSKEGGSIAIKIINTSIINGDFRYTDKSGNVAATANLNDVSISLSELYFATGDEQMNSFNINANNYTGGRLGITGKYRIQPLRMEANISANDIEVSSLSKFIENIIPMKLSKGSFSVSTDLLIEDNAGFILKTEKGNISVNNIIIDDNNTDPSMLSVVNIDVKDISLDLTKKNIFIEKVLLDNITMNQWMDEEGHIRYETILPAKGQEGNAENAEVAVKEGAEAPWDIAVKQVSLENSAVNFKDLNKNINQSYSLSGIKLDLMDFSLAPEKKTPFKFTAILNEKGSIDAEGNVCPSPFSMDMKYRLDKILLNPFSKYLETASWLRIEDGAVTLEGDVSAGSGAETSVNASLGINNIRLQDARFKNRLLSINEFRVDGVRAEVNRRNVSISSVGISAPELNISMSDQKKLNLAGLLREKDPGKVSDVSQTEEDKSGAWRYEIKKINLDNGTVLFSDKSVNPAYKTGMYNMTFSVDRIGSDMKDAAPFSFKADIDKYAPFIINGSLDPLDKQPGFAFKSTLSGIEMPHLSPYSGVYIGSNLKSGKLSLNLDYSLHDRKLNGKNNINAKNLYLGEKLPVKPVIDAPVGLGLALLRDISGVIDLDVGISGDLNDPGFSVSGIIIKAIVNIIVKAAASPFKLLAGLIPEGGDDLGTITFDPGSPSLNQENRDGLQKLSDALNERPQLVLTIKGNASGAEDIEAVKLSHLKQKVAEKRNTTLLVIEEELKGQELWIAAQNRDALEMINNEMGLPAFDIRMQKFVQEDSPENADDPDSFKAQDKNQVEQRLYKQVYDDMFAAEKVDEAELLSLAEARALSIMQYIVDDLKLSHERVSVIKATKGDLSGRVINLGLDVM